MKLALAALLAASPVFAQTVAQNFAAKADKLRSAIEHGQVDPVVKASFTEKLNKLLLGAGCSPIMMKAPDCAKATPSKLEEAQDGLDQLSDSWADAAKNDKGETLSELFKPKTDALLAKLKASRVDSTDANKLSEKIKDFTRSVVDSKQMGPKGPVLDKLNEQFSALSDDVDAAIQLSKDKNAGKNFAAQFKAKLDKVRTQLADSKLSSVFAADFNRQIAGIADSDGCPAVGGVAGKFGPVVKGKACVPDPSDLEAAEDKLEKLSDAITAAIAADGSKNLAEVYQTKVAALKKKLDDSKVDGTDKSTLERRLRNFQDSLAYGSGKGDALVGPKTSGIGAKKSSALEAAADDFEKLSDDVDAAIQLAGDKAGGATLAAGFMAKADALGKKIHDSKIDISIREALDARVAKAIGDAGCRSNDKAGPCAGATPSKLEKAAEELSQVSDDFDAAVKGGSKDLLGLYQAKIDALNAKIKAATLDHADKDKLARRLTAFSDELAHEQPSKNVGKGELPRLDPDKVAAEFSAISDDLDAAVKLQAEDAPKK